MPVSQSQNKKKNFEGRQKLGETNFGQEPILIQHHKHGRCDFDQVWQIVHFVLQIIEQ